MSCVASATRRAVDGLSLRLPKGSIGCLLGPSGCGKTTALRCIAGFEPVDAGSIRAHGRVLARPGFIEPPESRQIGMVFQDYALFPHLTVLRQRRVRSASPGRRARSATRPTRCSRPSVWPTTALTYPHQLSGGQQQRVALARALAPEPELVLLDEPFSSLDVELRERLGVEVRAMLKTLNATALLVTHDQQEAFAVADLVGVMREGRLEQWDAPYELYHRPGDALRRRLHRPGRVRRRARWSAPAPCETEIGVVRANGSGRLASGQARRSAAASGRRHSRRCQRAARGSLSACVSRRRVPLHAEDAERRAPAVARAESSQSRSRRAASASASSRITSWRSNANG